MKILAIESSTDNCSVALLVEDRCFARSVVAPRVHTGLLLPMIDEILKQGATSLEALSCLALGDGPGSFTGLRIACSAIQGLSVGSNKPVVPLSSLRALAQGIYRTDHHSRIFAYREAGRGQIYGGHYALDTQALMQTVQEDALYPIEALRTFAEDWTVATGLPEAQDLLYMAAEAMRAGSVVPPADLSPRYLGSLF